MKEIEGLGLGRARATGGFWAAKADLVAREMLPHQWMALNDEVPGAAKSHAIENYRIASGESKGEFHGNIFQDSDVAKWLEAASYSLSHHPDPELAARVAEAARLVAAAQRPDGYVDSYFLVAAPGERWADLAWGHELYCAGHLIEASVAHNASTGERTLLDVARRLADCIDARFGEGPGKLRAACGHPEIELALYRLWRATGEPRYRDLAGFFVRERGRDPEAFVGKEPLGFDIPKTKAFLADYFIGHEPASDQREATGHAVRAVYFYSAMADEVAETGDPKLLEALRGIWGSLEGRRMHITGGIGSQAQGERFTVDYDLPPDTAYAETCASIGLAFWASRMSLIDPDGRYADAVERVAYNGALSGAALDGRKYFYVNPLESNHAVAAARADLEHVMPRRVAWLGCSCCPPNIARFIASFPAYAYGEGGGAAWVHQYVEGEASFELGGARLSLSVSTDYPWLGEVRLRLGLAAPTSFALKLRVPGWCGSFSCSVNGRTLGPAELPVERGYLGIRREWRGGDSVLLSLDMAPRFLRAHDSVAELAGRLAVQRGPLVYCFEEIDVGKGLHELELDPEGPVEAEFDADLMGGSVRIEASGYRVARERRDGPGSPLYAPYAGDRERRRAVKLVAVPYHQWGNRAPGQEMRVWLRSSTPI